MVIKLIAHEYMHWDQVSLLVQIGPVNNKSLQISGIQQAKTLVDTATKREIMNKLSGKLFLTITD